MRHHDLAAQSGPKRRFLAHGFVSKLPKKEGYLFGHKKKQNRLEFVVLRALSWTHSHIAVLRSK